MSRLRMVSIAVDRPGQPVDARLALIDGPEVTILLPQGDGAPIGTAHPVRRLSGRGLAARFGRRTMLSDALSLLDPDVIHLRADATLALSRNVARWCRTRGRGLLLDGVATGSVICRHRPGTVIRSAQVVLVGSGAERDELIERKLAQTVIVSTLGVDRAASMPRDEARAALGIPHDTALVVGWRGKLDRNSEIDRLLEAVGLCDRVAIVVEDRPAVGWTTERVRQRADALDLLGSLVVVSPDQWSSGILALDVAVVTTPEWVGPMQVNGIPVIHDGRTAIAEKAGPGGWPVPGGDPALLARLLAELAARPDLVREAESVTTEHARRRHSTEAAAVDLALAVRLADLGRKLPRSARAPLGPRLLAAVRGAPNRPCQP